ncbi:MAG: serine/threonine-protein kinase, partial [Ignavibacteriaceae bacterium]
MIGTTISHYKILEKLGEGGMGIVYKAEDNNLKRPVALKFISPVLTRDKFANEQFIFEAQTASSLDHQNISTIYEIDESDDGRMFISMAYYKGETLREKISRGQIPIKEVVDIAIQIAEGLIKAHRKGIIHKDIKPANIMIDEDSTVKIIDFGLSKLLSTYKIAQPKSTMGTVSYMSPEQIKGKMIDFRTDIWSLGVVMYEMLTNKRPFEGEYDQAVIYSILNEDPEPMTGLRT